MVDSDRHPRVRELVHCVRPWMPAVLVPRTARIDSMKDVPVEKLNDMECESSDL